MIDLPTKQLALVKAILMQGAPGIPAFVFGSRATGRAKKHSDLDIALMPQKPLDWLVVANLREAFEASALPITVDVLDWTTCSDEFRKLVAPQLVALATELS